MKTILTVESGMKFNRLTAIKDMGKDKSGHPQWLFRCECGTEKVLSRYSVCSGKTRSCGCLNNEVRKSGVNGRVHGGCGTRLYRIWKAMKARCNAPEGSRNWNWYTARGITYCEEWQEYEPFRDWALANGYNDTLTIDRIDVNGNYSPDNCRWATLKEQANNKRNNRLIPYNDEIHTLSEWADITGISFTLLNCRYYRGYRGEKLFREPRKGVVWVKT